MRYARQSRNACLAYALLQLGVVSRRKVREYEKAIRYGGAGWKHVGDWLSKYAPDVAEILLRNGGSCPDWKVRKLPAGQGVLIIEHKTGRHAISFKGGEVLDPSQTAPGRRESLKELRIRYLKTEGSKVRLLAAINVEM